MEPDLYKPNPTSLHWLGVLCGLAAGAWLGAAEAPVKLVTVGLSPYSVSLSMVIGVFVARWTFPTLLKGTHYVFKDLSSRPHLMVWAVIAGALWAIANTLTVFAIRDVGLAVAFPLWNANGLVGLVWGRLLFGELKGARDSIILRVVLGALLITVAAAMLGFSAMHTNFTGGSHAQRGVVAALGACLLWGTMYVPYRKAYLSGMNPLSFVTIFTVGELFTVAAAAIALGGGISSIARELHLVRGLLFWLFLGGFVWVVGDLFQQFTAKYLGIGRGISLANTNQLWGLAWAALVFGELRGAGLSQYLLVIGGSVGMIVGVMMIGSGAASGKERTSQVDAIRRECDRYNLDYRQTLCLLEGVEEDSAEAVRHWWDYLIMSVAVAFFIWFAASATVPSMSLNRFWIGILGAAALALLATGCMRLWRTTGFS
ncbi:MAG: GRP family sugar transporter [Acidobacteriia bacterium]|nr:GRP family sugar transporter [Terriglobia bacterium]